MEGVVLPSVSPMDQLLARHAQVPVVDIYALVTGVPQRQQVHLQVSKTPKIQVQMVS